MKSSNIIYGYVWECSKCKRKFIVPDNSKIKCPECGYKWE
jgi:DNA-directed RNA polymerase subunit RPC12/RpoP